MQEQSQQSHLLSDEVKKTIIQMKQDGFNNKVISKGVGFQYNGPGLSATRVKNL